RLLSLLQRRPYWGGPELADRLGVTTRTVRRDVQRLRDLGYPVESVPGEGGGYELGVGGSLPPLLLDDDEATAIAVSLGLSTGNAVRGIEGPALAALAKLDRLLPPRLRARVEAVRSSTVTIGPPEDAIDADVLVTLAQACDGHERVVASYRDRAGVASERRLEPYALVATGRRWYLFCRDLDRDDWRTFRVDRVADVRRTGHRFAPDPDAPDAASTVGRAITTAPYRHQAVVSFASTSPAALRRLVPPTVGVVRGDGSGGSVLTTGADDIDSLALHLVALGRDFVVDEPDELRAALRALATRARRASSPVR
ncbi:MAG TPA: WYL domain-containing protein, partial [Frankiaceae bacterium]|nr:WYL domain-containing protein [Frankiaceae bacterium]